jgi:hypothetical protein
MHISHNDMHWGNILVVDKTCDQKRVYEFEGLTYEIESRYQPMLFDWDRSQIDDGIENQELNDYANQFAPKFSTARDWLALYQALLRNYGTLEDRPPVGDLFHMFFDAATPSEVHKKWRSVTSRRRKWWTFAQNSSLPVFQPHVSIDTPALLGFLGCTPAKPMTPSAVSVPETVSASELTPTTLWTRYNVKSFWVDLAHLKQLQDHFSSQWGVIRLLTSEKIRIFLRDHSSAFRTLRTSRGRKGHVDRLRSIVYAITKSIHFPYK